MSLEIVTTGTGYFVAGVRGRIVAGGECLVYLGEPPAPFTLPEFTIEFVGKNGKSWRREFCQYGRDFVFHTES